jgi:hypothetical protein
MISWLTKINKRSHLHIGYIAVFCGVCAVSVPAHAGMLASTSNALTYNATEWKGSDTIATGTIEYAVFGPGKFGDFMSEYSIGGADPTDPSLLTYAYQLIDVPSDASVSVLTVGEFINHEASHVAGLYPALWLNTGSPQQSPVAGADQGTSWAWFFNPDRITDGETSAILYFQSDKLPEYDNASASAPNGGTASPTIASIGATTTGGGIPEPGSLTLLLLGVFSLLAIDCQRTKPRQGLR